MTMCVVWNAVTNGKNTRTEIRTNIKKNYDEKKTLHQDVNNHRISNDVVALTTRKFQ